MATNYKILGQGVNSLKIDAPSNGSTVISELKIKNTSYPCTVDVACGDVLRTSLIDTAETVLSKEAYGNAAGPSVLRLSNGKYITGSYYGNPAETAAYNLATYEFDENNELVTKNYNQNKLFEYDYHYNEGTIPGITKYDIDNNGRHIVASTGDYLGEILEINRYLPDYSLDTGFNIKNSNLIGNNLEQLISDNNKVIVVYRKPESNNIAYVVRLSEDGSIDETFSQTTISSTGTLEVNMLKKLDDSLFLSVVDYAYYTPEYGYKAGHRVIKINIDGGVDESFSMTDILSASQTLGTIFDIAQQSSGKLIIAGRFETGSYRGIARLNSDGSLDNTFSTDAYIYDYTKRVVVLSDDSIIYAGTNSFITQSNYPTNRIAKLNSDGSRNASFYANASNSVFVSGIPDLDIYDIDLLENDNVVFVQRQNSDYFVRYIAVVSSDGLLVGSPVPTYAVYKIVANGSNSISIYGSFRGIDVYVNDSKLIVLNSDFSIDKSYDFANSYPSINSPKNIFEVEDGKIMLHGYSSSVSDDVLIRLNPDLSLDASFNFIRFYNTSDIYNVIVLDNGNYLIGGRFSDINNNSSYSNVAIISNTGSIVSGYTFSSPYTYVYTIKQLNNANRNIFIGGNFGNINGSGINYLAVLNSDGTLNTGFNYSLDSTVHEVDTQSDGSVLVAGRFSSVSGQTRHRIFRLTPNLALDTSFNANFDPYYGAFESYVFNMVVDSQDRIYIAGGFALFNDTFVSQGTNDPIAEDDLYSREIARLLPDGAVDVSFLTDKSFGAENRPNSTIITADDRLMIAEKYNFGLHVFLETIVNPYTYYNSDPNNYIIKNKPLNYDEEIKIFGGLVIDSGKSLMIETSQSYPDTVIIQAYGIEETA